MKRLGSMVGALVGVLGLAFVGRELATSREEVLSATTGADPLALLVSAVVAVLSMGLIGIGWLRCLRVLGVEVPRLVGLRYYYVGQLGKYIPGGVWPVIGRSELARRGGVPAATAYASTVLSLGLTYLAAMLVVIVLLVANGGAGDSTWLPVLLLAPLGIGLLHPRVVDLALGLVRRVTGRELPLTSLPWPVGIGLLLRHIPPWVGVCGGTLVIAATVDSAPLDPVNIGFATALSWVVGFLAIGVPGGVGVREAVFVATATSLSSSGTAAAVAVIARLVFLFGDVTGAAVATAAVSLATRHRERTLR